MSLALCCVIIVSSGYGFTRRAALDENAVQSAHTGFVPRVGGIAIYLSILGFIPLLNFGFIPITVFFELKIYDMILLILSASPIFFIGIAEDLGYPMSPQIRLIASAISSLLVIIMFKTGLYVRNTRHRRPFGICTSRYSFHYFCYSGCCKCL